MGTFSWSDTVGGIKPLSDLPPSKCQIVCVGFRFSPVSSGVLG